MLIGDSSVRNIQSQVRNMLSSTLSGVGGSLTTLPQIGISFQKDGTMALDASKLQSAITANFNDIGALFASVGTASDSLVSYVSSSPATKPGNNALSLTALASQGKITGSAAPVSLVVAAGVNDQLSMTVDGVSATITLAPNTYTSASLLAQMQSAINGASELSSAGIAVNVSADAGGILSITSNRYGTASKVSASGSAASHLFGTATSTDGIDVAGSINGIDAIGSGQFLSGATGSTADGLTLQITGGVASGPRGTVNFSRGYAYRLNKLVDNFIGGTGSISGQTKSIDSSIKDIGKSREDTIARLQNVEKRYRAQFTALDALMSKMTTTSTFLTQQLAQISNLSSQ